MLKINVNDQNFEVENQQLNGQPFAWDLARLDDNRFHILQNNQSYNAEVVEANYTDKIFKIKVNGSIYQVSAKDKLDLLLEKMGMSAATKAKVNKIEAPMPGLIWEIKVKVGDHVQAGDVVLVLVAMKMENALKSAGEGIVKSIKVNKGDSVEKKQLLIEFE
jgi:biotin carboxyl carrier protein